MSPEVKQFTFIGKNMKNTLLIFLLIIGSYCDAQNVGIGNSSPAEKLDVTGNINVTGTIKANGVDGTANQVLMKNSGGVLQWGDMCEFKSLYTFFSSGEFTIPAGVTRIAVELWGAGGGGNTNAAGGGGGYLRAQINVTPGDICTVDVGSGGPGAVNANATAGEGTTISVPGTFYQATGGGGATYTASTRYNPGLGGGFTISASQHSYYGVYGTSGGVVKRNYVQVNATTFYEMADGGDGGFAFNSPSGGGNAPHIIYNLTGTATVQLNYGNSDGRSPGGAGASGLSYGAGALIGGGAGGKGLVIIHY